MKAKGNRRRYFTACKGDVPILRAGGNNFLVLWVCVMLYYLINAILQISTSHLHWAYVLILLFMTFFVWAILCVYTRAVTSLRLRESCLEVWLPLSVVRLHIGQLEDFDFRISRATQELQLIIKMSYGARYVFGFAKALDSGRPYLSDTAYDARRIEVVQVLRKWQDSNSDRA